MRILITGVAGYLGTALCRELEHQPWCSQVHGCDIKPPLYKFDKLEFRHLDINDPQLEAWTRHIAPDALVHLAFVVDPIRDVEGQRRVNIRGTQRVLAAAAAARVKLISVASSGTAYGAWPDNPIPLTETDPLRPHPTFQYASEKGELEALCRTFTATHPDIVFSIVRPCVIYGPLVDNYLSKLLTGLPWVTGLAGYDPPLQFVHEDDAARAITTILLEQGTGPYNVAPPDTVTMSEVIAATPKPNLQLPLWLLRPVAKLAWRLQLPLLEAPADMLDYLRYPWVLDPTRLQELGFAFRYSSRETLLSMLRAKGLSPESG